MAPFRSLMKNLASLDENRVFTSSSKPNSKLPKLSELEKQRLRDLAAAQALIDIVVRLAESIHSLIFRCNKETMNLRYLEYCVSGPWCILACGTTSLFEHP